MIQSIKTDSETNLPPALRGLNRRLGKVDFIHIHPHPGQRAFWKLRQFSGKPALQD